MVQLDITNSIKALKINLSDNEQFYINGDIDEKTYLYMKSQIEMKLHYYLSFFGDEDCHGEDEDYPCDIYNDF